MKIPHDIECDFKKASHFNSYDVVLGYNCYVLGLGNNRVVLGQ